MDKEISVLLQPNQSIVTFLCQLADIGSIMVILIGLLCLIGWQFGLSYVSVFFPNATGMNPVAAVGYISLGCSLFLHLHNERKTLWKSLGIGIVSSITIMLGVVTILNTMSSLHLLFDQLLFTSKLEGNSISQNSGFTFVCIGTALLFFEFATKKIIIRFAQIVTLLASAISMFAIISFAYRSFTFYEGTFFSTMPISSAVTSAILCISILFAKSNRGLIKVLTRSTPSSVMAFRLILITLTLPALLGYLSLLGVRFNFYDLQTAIVLLVIENIIFITAIIWFNSSVVQKLELENLIIANEMKKKDFKLEVNAKDLAARMLTLEEKNQEVSEKLINKEKLFAVTDNLE